MGTSDRLSKDPEGGFSSGSFLLGFLIGGSTGIAAVVASAGWPWIGFPMPVLLGIVGLLLAWMGVLVLVRGMMRLLWSVLEGQRRAVESGLSAVTRQLARSSTHHAMPAVETIARSGSGFDEPSTAGRESTEPASVDVPDPVVESRSGSGSAWLRPTPGPGHGRESASPGPRSASDVAGDRDTSVPQAAAASSVGRPAGGSESWRRASKPGLDQSADPRAAGDVSWTPSDALADSPSSFPVGHLMDIWDDYRDDGDGTFRAQAFERRLADHGLDLRVWPGSRLDMNNGVLVVGRDIRDELILVPSFNKAPRELEAWFDSEAGVRRPRIQRWHHPARIRYRRGVVEVLERGRVE